MGVSTETQDPDLATAFAGGDTFIQRMEQLSAAKAAAERAEASLNLGMSARAIMDRYEAKLADAERALDDARKQAKVIISDAEAEAAAKVADAEQKALAAIKDASKAQADTDAYSAAALQRADAMISAASQKLQEAAAKLDAANRAQTEADAALAKAEGAQSAASDAEHRFKGCLAILKTACAEVLASE